MKAQVKLQEKKVVARGTMAFNFEKPAGFNFKAGQYLDLTLINPPETDAAGNIRTFSIASRPSADHLMVVTRIRDSAFKRTIANLNLGDPVTIDGPMGSFTLRQNSTRPAVFLAGGIGLTPFFSLVQDAAERSLPHRIFLFYSNHKPEGAPFLAELDQLTQANPNFKFIPTMTKLDDPETAWRGERGHLTIRLINKYLPAEAQAVYYAAGSATFVNAMRELLTTAGVSDDDLKTEDFAGY